MQRTSIAVMALIAGTLLAVSQPLPAEESPPTKGLSQPIADSAPPNNAGLFLGVNKFNDDPDIPPLQFAVHDAVEQAHMFVVKLKLIPAKNCFLAVSGEPSNQDVRDHLDALKRLGVNLIEAEKSTVLRALLKLRAISTDVSDMVVVSLSSHGFEESGKAFVMPADGLKDFLADTAINLDTLEGQLKKSKAGQQILLVDACQEKVSVSAEKGIAVRPTSKMGSGFSNALNVTSGQARLASCSEGEFSYEHRDLRDCGHGVFTAKLLEALEGNAGGDADNVIRMESVANYVRSGVNQWVDEQNRLSGAQLKQQSPAWFGSDAAGQFRLAKRMGGSQALIALLMAQQHPRAFDEQLRTQLVSRLKQCDGSHPDDAEILTQVAGYIEGRTSVALFIPYLRHKLADSPVMPIEPNPEHGNDDSPANAREEDIDKMRSVVFGMDVFHEKKDQFPADIASRDGRRLLSWRVRMLSMIDQEDLQKQFRIDEPWDSPHNIRLLDKMPEIFRTRSWPAKSGYTRILRPTGNGTPANLSPGTYGGLPGELGNTIACILAETAVPWTKPVDYRVDRANPRKGLAEGAMAAMYDMSAVSVGSFNDEQLRGAYTASADDGADWVNPTSTEFEPVELTVAVDFSVYVSRLMKNHRLAGTLNKLFGNFAAKLSDVDRATIVMFAGPDDDEFTVKTFTTVRPVDVERVVRGLLGAVPNDESFEIAGRTFHIWNQPDVGTVLHSAESNLFAKFSRIADMEILLDHYPEHFHEMLVASAESFHGDLATGFMDLRVMRTQEVHDNDPPIVKELFANADEVDLSLSDENGLQLIATVMTTSRERSERSLDCVAGVLELILEAITRETAVQSAPAEVKGLVKSLTRAVKDARPTIHGTDVEVTLNIPDDVISVVPAPHVPSSRGRFFLPARKSADKGGQTDMVVTNEMRQTVNLYWVDHSGNRVSFGQIRPGRSQSLQTSVGHVWLVKSLANRDLAAFESRSGWHEIRISQNTIGGLTKVMPNMPNPLAMSPLVGKWKCSCGGIWDLKQNGNRLSGTESRPNELNRVSGTWSGNQFVFTYTEPGGETASGIMNVNGDRATATLKWQAGDTSTPTLTRIRGSSSGITPNMPNPLSTSPLVGRWQCSCGDVWTLRQNGSRLIGSETGNEGLNSVSGSWSGNQFIFTYVKPSGKTASGVMNVNGDRATATLNWQGGGTSNPTLTRIR